LLANFPSRYFVYALGLLLLSWVCYSIESIIYDEDEFVVASIEERLSVLVKEQADFIDRVEENFSEGTYRVVNQHNRDFPTFIFVSGQLKSWSSNDLIPAYTELAGDYEFRLVTGEDATYLARKRTLASRSAQTELFSIIILERRYAVENRYIKDARNSALFPIGAKIVEVGESEGVDIRLDGNTLYRVTLGDSHTDKSGTLIMLSLFLFGIGLAILIAALYRWSEMLARAIGFTSGLIILVAGFLALRTLLEFSDLPGSIWPSDIFDPRTYYSSEHNSSIGELLINLLLLVLVAWYSLINFSVKRAVRKLINTPPVLRTLVVFVLTLVSIICLYGHVWLVQNISFNSQIELDVSASITFPGARMVAYGCFAIYAILFFLIHQLTARFIQILRISPVSIGIIIALAYGLVAGLFHSYALWWLVFLLHLIFLLLSWSTGWVGTLKRIRYNTFLYLFTSALLSTAMFAAALYKAQERNTLIAKQKFANQLLIENDVLGEYLLSEAIDNITDDVQIKSRFLNPRLLTTQTAYHIRERHMNEYFDKYEISILFFNDDGALMNQTDGPSFENLSNDLLTLDNRTEYKDIYFVNDLTSTGVYKYLAVVPVTRYDTFLGHIVLDLRLKRYIPTSLYPELLIDQRFFYAPQPDFNYALYQGNRLIYEAGGYSYASAFNKENLNVEKLYIEGSEDVLMHHLGVRDIDDKVFIISSTKYPNKDIIANFSFLFMMMVFLIVLLTVVDAIKLRFREVELNFATRLQIYLSLAFFLPLLVTTIVVLNTINESYKEELDITYQEKADNISQQVIGELKSYSEGETNRIQLSQLVSDISRYSQVDVNLFDGLGRLVASSQQRIFDNKLKSAYINPQALYQIISGEQESVTFDEQIGELNYRSTYHAIRSDSDGHLLGTLSIPFFESSNDLKNEQLDVFTSLLNIFTLIFLVSLVFINLATSFLTRPLDLITQKLSKTRLEDKNQPIDWKSNDEIGVLVKEYNRMLVNLEKSKASLAKNEKEVAWREMAKQVAHEIKNPLTPMKLTLQQLQRTLADQGKVTNAERPIKTVLNQIDTLSDIATSFSAFAKMPIPVNSKTDVSAVLKETLLLFDEKCKISTDLPSKEYCVFADGKLLGRIFNNLILNGIQSVPDGKEPSIRVALKEKDQRISISFQDNGVGISDEHTEKIFVPNFSTKTTGSGLGLAIAKRGIEHAGGSISFTTEVGVGTEFIIELPLYQE